MRRATASERWTLLEAALLTTRELGMRALEERITAVQSRMKAELN